MSIEKLYLLYTTGRSGTAYLSQCFGGDFWEKKKVHITSSNMIVAHEPWSDIPVELIKKVSFKSAEYFKISNKYIDHKIYELEKGYPFARKLFITDHKLGRYLGPGFVNKGMNFGLIYIERDADDVANSFCRKSFQKKIELDEKRYKRYLKRMWEANKFAPTDSFISEKMSIDKWNKFSEFQKYLWYTKEVKLQWNDLKSNLLDEQYIECFFSKASRKKMLDRISKFIGEPYNLDLVNVKANATK